MRTYAHIENGVVAELVTPGPDLDGNQYDLELCFPKSFVDACIEITGLDPMPGQRWTYNGKIFAKPVPAMPTAAELALQAIAKRNALLVIANEATAGMADAYIAGLLDDADVAIFRAYAAYKLQLNKIDKQPGYPQAIDWPSSPV